nr:zinc finger, CCHC-type [Tanacetum cinerariifolium]
MLMTMDPEIQKTLEHLGAYDMLQDLKTLYVQQADQELLQTVREFHACKQEKGQSVSSYFLKMKSYIDNLEHLGHAMTRNLSVSLIFVSLRKEYDSFVQNYNMHSIGKTVNELHAMLKLHEQTLPPKEVAPALHAIRAGRIQKNQMKKSHKTAKGNQGKGKVKMGYAPVQAPPFAPKPKNPPTLKKDIPTKDAICHRCELYYFPSTSWVYDTGCGTHICITTEGLRGSRKLKPEALSLYVGDGHPAIVEAIGDFHLCLPSGLVLILQNCHYAPSITRGIISVSCLYKDGFVNRFDNDNSIFVFKNNMIYFNAIPRDDIYEIVMSSSNTNECSMYVVTNKRAKLNLDFALLWHCCLRHINKKRIEKLQHDRLLDSTDIKSFEKCVACISGKMERKPYSHQVKKGQRFTWTNPHRYKRNKTLLDMVRSIMSQTTLPKSFRDYALESAICILNMVPTKKVDKTPYEVWHGKVPKLSYLKVWGYEALVKHDTLTKPDKLEPRSIKCIFVGYPKETMRYSFYYPPENKVFVARNAEFLENSLINHEASESLDDLKIIQDEDTHPSLDTSSLKCFAMKDLREAAYILGINIYRDRSKRLIGLCQSAYIEKILKTFYMENSKRNTIPMQEKIKFSKSQGASTPAEIHRMQNYPYALAVGSIMYDVRDAEYIAAFDASKEAVWIRKFISGLGVVPTIKEPINMYCDNTGDIAIAKDHGVTKGARHFRAKVHYL